MSKPKVSVIIPVFNTEKYLEACLDSVSRQTLANIEIICVDDGSTDSSPSILKTHSAKDPRVKIITQANRGAGAARNAGMSVATGKYLSFLDSDDYYDPEMLETLVDTAEENMSEIAICGSYIVNESTGMKSEFGKSLRTDLIPSDCFSPTDIGENLFQFSMGWAWDKLFLSDHVKGLKFQEISSNNDVYFVFTSLANAERIAVTKKHLCYHRKNTNGSLQDNIGNTYDNIFVSRKALFEKLTKEDLVEQFGDSFFSNLKDKIVYYAHRLRHDGAFEGYCEYVRKEVMPIYGERITEGNSEYDDEIRTIIDGTYHIPHTVSVIIPVYNSEKYLKECLDSVVGQNLPFMEIICIDDGSTDGSLSILKDYASKDDRIKILTMENGGAGTARNAGIDAADSEYIAFLDSDDILEKDCISKLFGFATGSRAEILKTSCTAFDDASGNKVDNTLYSLEAMDSKYFMKVTNINRTPSIINKLPAVPWNGLYDTNFIKANKLRFNDLVCVNDRSFHVATYSRAERVFITNVPMVRHRVNNAGSLIGLRFENFQCEFDSYNIIRKDISELSADMKARILRSEISDIFGWYRKACEQGKNVESIESMMVEFVKGLDASELGKITGSGWYPTYIRFLCRAIDEVEGDLERMPQVIRQILVKELFSGDLGRIYLGKKVDKDCYTAILYLKIACIHSNDRLPELCKAMYNSGNPEYRKDALEMCRASERPSLKALEAMMYEEGTCVEKDLGRSAEILSGIYKGNKNITKQYIGVLDKIDTPESKKLSFELKVGIGRSESELTELWKGNQNDLELLLALVSPGAEKKEPLACGFLGRMYAAGKVVDKDDVKAAEYLTIAADGGLEWAESELLNVLWRLGDRGSVMEMLYRASNLADKGNKNAISHMAKAFRYGNGTDKDLEYAADLLRGIYEGNAGWTKDLIDILTEIGDEASLKEAEKIKENGKR